MAVTIRGLDIFCGAGGSSDGARLAGVEMVGGVDMDPLAVATWQDNFPGGIGWCDRLESMDLSVAETLFGPVDLLLASPECTNHTPAKGNAPRSEASRDTAMLVVRYAARLKPRWIIVENVIQMKPWARFDEFAGALSSLGYHLSCQTLNAADFGVPQTRRRLFVLADLGGPPPLVKSRGNPRRCARSILDPRGTWPTTPLMKSGRAPDTIARAERAIRALGPAADFLLVYYGSDGAGGWQSLDRPLRTITTLDRFALVEHSPGGHTMRMLQPSELRVRLETHAALARRRARSMTDAA